jgi:hypothetical protein
MLKRFFYAESAQAPKAFLRPGPSAILSLREPQARVPPIFWRRGPKNRLPHVPPRRRCAALTLVNRLTGGPVLDGKRFNLKEIIP